MGYSRDWRFRGVAVGRWSCPALLLAVACGDTVTVSGSGMAGADVGGSTTTVTTGGGASGGEAGHGGTGGSTPCGNLDDNPLHCGYCNHSCLGGECINGVCQAVVLADLDGIESATTLAVDETHVYWADGIRRVNKQGGAFEDVAGAGVGDHWGIAVDDTHVFWVTVFAPGLYRAPKNGGSATLLAPDAGYRVALDDTHVYFNWNGLRRIAKAGGPLELLSPEGDTGVVVDEQYVYWTQWSTTSVMRLPKSGGAAVTLATPVGADYMAEHGDHVYWANPGELAIRRVPKQGGNVETLATGVGAQMGIAVDDDGVFWTDFQGGRIMMAPHEGGAATELSSGHHDPRDITVDGDAVYWTDDPIYSKIMKIAKP